MRQALLVGIAGPLGPPQLACLRSWRRLGHRTVFFHLGTKPIPKMFRGIATHYDFFPASESLQSSLGRIRTRCLELNVTGITVVAEQLALKLSDAWSQAAPTATKLYLNRPATYECLESKLAQVALATAAGLPVLPSLALTPASSVPLDFCRPWVLRPDVARSLRPLFKAEVVTTANELSSFLGTITTHDSKLVAQPLVRGPNVVVHGARACNGHWDHHEAFLTEVKSGGLAVSIRPHPIPQGVLSACRRFEESVSLHGIFHYDFLLDDQTGKLFFLEVNPRLGGTTAKAFAAGYDEPGALVATFESQDKQEQVFAGARNSAVSRIAYVRHLLRADDAVRKSGLDFREKRGLAAFARSCRTLLTYPDEVFWVTDTLGNLAFLSQID